MKAGFDGHGYEVVPFDGPADVYVVNTCTVTGSGDADSRRAVRRARRRNPDATVVATGCFAQRRPDELTGAGASLVVGNADKAGLVDAVHAHLATATPLPASHTSPASDTPAAVPRTERFLQIEGAVTAGRTRGTLQIQDGCDEHCTYCIIPSVRGAGVSRPPQEIVGQARRMVDAGYRELALTGVHSGSYGHDRDEPQALVDLLVQLEAIDGLARIRLNSVEPGYLTDELIDFAARSSHFCRHFHVPLQSGDDQILRRMGRHYTSAHYAERIERLAAVLPGGALGADVMVGFPGESETHFASTRSLIERLPLTYLHVFPYSLREGTAAQRLPAHETHQTKAARTRELIDLGLRKRLAFHRRHLGQLVRVLVERIGADGLATGLTDNYIRVRFEDPDGTVRANEFVEVLATHAREDVVFGQRVAA